MGALASDFPQVKSFYDGLRRRDGFAVTLRRITNDATGAAPNPPELLSPVLDGAVLAGATSFNIRAATADGRILPGDQVTIGGSGPFMVTNTTQATLYGIDPAAPSASGFTGVSVATPLPALPDGALVVPSWAGDSVVYVTEQNFNLNLNPDLTLAAMAQLTMAAWNANTPRVNDKILFPHTSRTILGVQPMISAGIVFAWRLQVR